MRQIVSFIIFAFYSLGLGFSNPSKSFAPSMKIKIEHIHEVAEGHSHHHDIENDGGHEDEHEENHEEDHDHDKNAEHKHSVPHSHEISVSMCGGCVLSSGHIIPVNMNLKVLETVSTTFTETPPKDISLSSIFRPPIA